MDHFPLNCVFQILHILFIFVQFKNFFFTNNASPEFMRFFFAFSSPSNELSKRISVRSETKNIDQKQFYLSFRRFPVANFSFFFQLLHEENTE